MITRSSIGLHDLASWLDDALQVGQFQDYCPNGVQVAAQGLDNAPIGRIVTGVSASRALIEAAIARKADALLVHHGYFWKGEPAALTGIKAERIRLLMRHGISLLAYHLPLDAHPQWGNNVALAEQMGWRITGALNPSERQPIGHVGHPSDPLTATELHAQLTAQLAQPVLHCPGGPARIHKIGWCTGAAQSQIVQAAQMGCDAYVSGEISERTWHEASELGIHYFAAGHHATERGGVQRLGAAIAQQFGVAVEFVDLAIPV